MVIQYKLNMICIKLSQIFKVILIHMIISKNWEIHFENISVTSKQQMFTLVLKWLERPFHVVSPSIKYTVIGASVVSSLYFVCSTPTWKVLDELELEVAKPLLLLEEVVFLHPTDVMSLLLRYMVIFQWNQMWWYHHFCQLRSLSSSWDLLFSTLFKSFRYSSYKRLHFLW